MNESGCVKENARKNKRNGIPSNVPKYFFIAEDSSVSIISNWKEILSEYVSKTKHGKFKMLDCDHYVHHEKSDDIALETKAFLKELIALGRVNILNISR